jgi:hypothetical protein
MPTYDGSSMFLWTEWPSMSGEADWIIFYARLIEYISVSEFNFSRIMLRMIDPTFGDKSTGYTTRDLWTVSRDSVIYQEFISKVPPQVKELVIYPYVLDYSNQVNWETSMGTAPGQTLEAVFKYFQAWNDLLGPDAPVKFTGIVVDGEEHKGFIDEIYNVPQYKAMYNGGWFGYCTGYPQVGVMTLYSEVVDVFVFQMYDFYADRSATLQLVQNTDVDNPDEFITRLNNLVWSRFLPFYENTKATFMWSNQHSGSTACLYPLGDNCGAKEDFGAVSKSYFISFLEKVKEMYPTKFGNKMNGIFQFSLTPASWFNPSE